MDIVVNEKPLGHIDFIKAMSQFGKCFNRKMVQFYPLVRKPMRRSYELDKTFQETGLKTRHLERLEKILNELDEFEKNRK